MSVSLQFCLLLAVCSLLTWIGMAATVTWLLWCQFNWVAVELTISCMKINVLNHVIVSQWSSLVVMSMLFISLRELFYSALCTRSTDVVGKTELNYAECHLIVLFFFISICVFRTPTSNPALSPSKLTQMDSSSTGLEGPTWSVKLANTSPVMSLSRILWKSMEPETVWLLIFF